MDAKEILPLIPDDHFDPSEIILIGAHMNPSPSGPPPSGKNVTSKQREQYAELLCTGEIKVRSDFAHMLQMKAVPKVRPNMSGELEVQCPTIALIYAYAYEGHTYRLAKPRIMIVKGPGAPYEQTSSKASDEPSTSTLFMWRMSKHHKTVSIEVESGELEALVLDANQPGNRAVNSYAAHMQMSHRGGKLS
jgi:hypothetical protein